MLFAARGQVAVLHLQAGMQRMLLSGATHAQYVAPGYLVYAAAGTLWAVPFDLNRLEITGTPVPVVEGLQAPPPPGVADVSVSADGTLVYVQGGPVAALPRSIVWVDRKGQEEELGAPARPYRYPRLSPDGTKVAIEIQDPDWNIWIWELSRQTFARLTLDPTSDQYPVWTPDGRRIVFRSAREGPFNLYGQAANGTVERLTQRPNEQSPYAVAPDGRQLVLREDSLGRGGDLMVLALDGEPRVSPLVHTAFNERNAELSPNGRWLAYESDESGREEIYIRPFPNVEGGRWQASSANATALSAPASIVIVQNWAEELKRLVPR